MSPVFKVKKFAGQKNHLNFLDRVLSVSVPLMSEYQFSAGECYADQRLVADRSFAVLSKVTLCK